MALFRRKTTDSVLPEVDEYYQAERRDRGWLAWLLAFLSVAVVALLIVGIFVGGRWAYNKITDDEPVAVTENTENNGLTVDGDPNAANNTENSEEQAPNQGGTGNDAENQGSQATPPAQESTPNPPTSTTPTTGDQSDNLPNTGPADLIGVFTGVSTLAGGIHYVVSRKRD